MYSYIAFRNVNLILLKEKYILGELAHILGDLGRSCIIFGVLWSKGKILSESWGIFLSGIWETSALFSGIKGAQTPPLGLGISCRRALQGLRSWFSHAMAPGSGIYVFLTNYWFDPVLFQDDLFKRYNETVANFEFGEIQFSLSWEATGVVRDLYLDRYIRRTDFPLDFLIQKNIYRPSMINAGSMNTHFILPRNLT